MRSESPQDVSAWLAAQGVRLRGLRRVAHLDCSVWRLSTGDATGELCLRIFPAAHQDAPQIDSELAWLAALHAEGLHVPGPLPDASGRLRRSFQPRAAQPPRHAALLHWLPGRMPGRALRPVHLRRLGELVARMHDAADRLTREGVLRRHTRAAHNADLAAWAEGRHRLDPAFPPGLAAAAQRAAQALLRQGAQDPATEAQHGFIHGDLHLWNLLFHQGRAGAIDFSDSGWGSRMQDLASPLQFIRHPLEGHADHRASEGAMRDALLDGYAALRPLPGDVLARIDLQIAARMLNTLQWIVDDWPAIDHRSWGPRFVAELESVLRHAAGG